VDSGEQIAAAPISEQGKKAVVERLQNTARSANTLVGLRCRLRWPPVMALVTVSGGAGGSDGVVMAMAMVMAVVVMVYRSDSGAYWA